MPAGISARRYRCCGKSNLPFSTFGCTPVSIPHREAGSSKRSGRSGDEVALIDYPAYNRLPHSFSHIFAGGYAAGYYSYKWAEVLAADAFGAFEESGIFDVETASRFRREILEIGGSRDFMEAYVAFRGRKPTLDALLRQSGIGKAA